MKWLIWSKIDLENGLGGVETHARCVARELRILGAQVSFSQNPTAPMDDSWDIVSSHGNQFPYSIKFYRWLRDQKKTFWFHTLHGWSFERMLACKEPLWLGAYKASAEEWLGATQCHQAFAIHKSLSFLSQINNVLICGNGWDSWAETAEISSETPEDKFLFIGRGSDKVKGARRVIPLAKDFKIEASPGEGFEKEESIIKTGRLTPEDIRKHLIKSRGLLVPSYYEGLPLVVLEALALGVPVVATPVGGLKTLSKNLQGLHFTNKNADNLKSEMEKITRQENLEVRKARKTANRQILQTWKDVAEIYYQKAKGLMGHD